MKRPPTMQQIAEAGGVSRMTVSLVMRNSPRVSEKTRRRIRALAEKMGYRPNPLVSALMAQRSGNKETNVGYPLALLDWGLTGKTLSQPMYRLVLGGIERRSCELGFYSQIFSVNTPAMPDARQLHKILRARGICGVIVLPVPQGLTTMDFPWEFYALATLGHSLLRPEIHRSASDQFRNGWMAMENIYRLGYRRPGLVISSETDRRTLFHFPAAYSAFPRNRPEVKIAPIFSGDPLRDFKEFHHWIEKTTPDVILSHGNILPLLNKMGRRVPEDVGVLSLDLHESNAGISGINPCLALVGAGAVDIVVSRLYRNEFGLPNHSRTMLITGEWIEGKTTQAQENAPL